MSGTEPAAAGLDRCRALTLWAAALLTVLVLQLAARWGSAGSSLSSQLLDGLNQFDGPEYLQIASEGYTQRQLVWFPLYPLLIRAVTVLTSSPLLGAVVVTVVMSAAATMLFDRWLRLRDPGISSRSTALLALLLYPYAFFLYGVIYSDALFLALCLGAFVAFERDRRGLAAVAAALATATRPSGFALVAGLLVMALERDGVLASDPRGDSWTARLGLPTRLSIRRFGRTALWPIAGFAGLAAYGVYQSWAFGSPLRFITEQANYHAPGAESALKQQFFSAFYGGFDFRYLATTTLQALILAAVIASVPAVGRRFGWGYATFTLGLALLPAVSVSTFMGVGRYLLPAFPAFALLGDWLGRHPRIRAPWLAASGALMFLMAYGFARSWYLS